MSAYEVKTRWNDNNKNMQTEHLLVRGRVRLEIESLLISLTDVCSAPFEHYEKLLFCRLNCLLVAVLFDARLSADTVKIQKLK